MERKIALVWILLSLSCLLTACVEGGATIGMDGGEAGDQAMDAAPYMGVGAPPMTPVPVPAEEPVYGFQAEVEREESHHEDGTLLAYCDYSWQSLLVTNLDRVSPEDRESAERNVEAFNARMREQADAAQTGGGLADYAEEAYRDGYGASLPYYEEMFAQAAVCGHVVVVREDYCYNTGGAHPNYAVDSLIFDLSSGQFIAPMQVADDPAAFHAGAVELLIAEAGSLGPEYASGYWPDYQETIRLWDSTAAVLFDEEGMTVVFSPYDLGPYAMGSVELTLSREELEELIGPGGMEKLGWMEGTED